MIIGCGLWMVEVAQFADGKFEPAVLPEHEQPSALPVEDPRSSELSLCSQQPDGR